MSSEILSQSSETALDQSIENSKKETVALGKEVVQNAERGNHPDPIRYFSNWNELTPEVKDEFERVIDTRLESLLDEANQKREELQVTPITKLYFAEGVMELHLINPEKKTDIILFNQSTDGMTRSDQGIVSPELYAFLNSNEDALKRYLTDKVEYIREKKTPKVMPRDFSIEQGAEIVDSGKVKNALKMLQNLVFILRQIEGDSYFGGDKKLVGLKQLLEDAEAGCLYSNELSKRKVDALIEQVYPVFDQFIKEEESGTQYGEFSEESIFKDKKGNFRKLFYVDEQKQREIIRSFAGTKANFLQRYLEDDNFSVEDQEANQVIQNIEKLFTIEEGDVNENGEVINPEKKKAFDDLFTAENPGELGSLLKTLGIDIPTFKKEDLGGQMELLEKLHTELQTIKTKLEPNNLPSKDSLKEDFQNQKEALERKNPKTFMEECMLVRLEQNLADEKQLNALYEEQKQQYIFELKYHAPLSLMRSVFYPTLAEYGKGATGPNGEMYNDMIGYGFFDISDANYDLASQIIKETLITVTAGIMTAGIGLGMTSGTMALAASTNSLRIGKIARTLYQGYSRAQRAKLVKIGLKGGGCILEGTMFNANMDLLHAVVNGESLDGLNLNPVDTENLRTAVMIAFLKCSHSMKPANGKYLDIEGKLSTINSMINPVIDLGIDITSLVTAEEVNNVVFGKDVIIDGKIITERGITKIEGAEVAQMIGLILMNKLCYGTIFQEALKKKAFKIEKINNQYRTILENQAGEPIEQILDKIPKQCQYKFLTKEGKLFYQREDGSLVQTLSYKDAMWFLNTENKGLGKTETNNDVQELPPSQQQLTNGGQRSHKYSGDRDPFDEVIENQMKKAEAADDQRPPIVRDLTEEELINISGGQGSLRGPGGSYLEPGGGGRRGNYGKKFWTPNDNYGGNEHGGYESSKDRIPQTIDGLKFSINTAIDGLDKNLSNWYIKGPQDIDRWCNFPEIDKNIRVLFEQRRILETILKDIEMEKIGGVFNDESLRDYAIRRNNAINDIDYVVTQIDKKIVEKKGNMDAHQWTEYILSNLHRATVFNKTVEPVGARENLDYGTTKEGAVQKIKERLQEKYNFTNATLENIVPDNILPEKLNLLKLILNSPEFEAEFFRTFTKTPEGVRKGGEKGTSLILRDMLGLDRHSGYIFLEGLKEPYFSYLPKNLSVDQYVRGVKQIIADNPGITSSFAIVQTLQKQIESGTFGSGEKLNLSPKEVQELLAKKEHRVGSGGININKYGPLFKHINDIDYLQDVFKGKKFSEDDLQILLTLQPYQRNLIRTLGKNADVIKEFFQSPGKSVDFSVANITNLDLDSFAKYLGIIENHHLLKKCFDPDIYPMIKNSNPVIDYNDLVGYINEYNKNWQNNMTFKQYLQQRFTKN